MDESVSDWLVGIAVAAFGLLGTVLAAGARDVEMSVFGYGLFGFAVLFDLAIMRRRLNAADAAALGAVRHA